MAKAKKKILIIAVVALVATVAIVGIVFKVNNSWALKVLCANGFESVTIEPNFQKRDPYAFNEKELAIFTKFINDTAVYKKETDAPNIVGMPPHIVVTMKNKKQFRFEFAYMPDTSYIIIGKTWYICNVDDVGKIRNFIDDVYDAHFPNIL